MPGNFSFLIPGKLAGCAQPGRFSDLRSDLSGLSRQGIGVIVSLTETPLDPAAIRDYDFLSLHLPVADYTPPSRTQIRRFVEFTHQCITDGRAVVVHCTAGMGRTGTMLACFLVSQGMSASDAVLTVRQARPGSIETAEQERCILDFARTVKKKKKR
ncbi:MAG: dual specificity protein phosphatase family protein [Planctomycetaceae bacterium]|nr:dual specificity protein phosphatase family protein [Planctomycetaceae bacterium]